MMPFLSMIEAWKSPQEKLNKVIRWKKYLENARPQNSLQHSHSITILGIMVLSRIKSFVSLDEGLILSALTLHDVAEGEVGFDTLYIDKTNLSDEKEYFAFVKLYQKTSPDVFDYLHKAFLLQFAFKDPEDFPSSARTEITELRKTKRNEALCFEAIERLDYVFYAIEQATEKNNTKILIQTLRHQLSHLNKLNQELPGFETIWTEEISQWAQQLLSTYEGLWIETKESVF